MIQQGYLSRIQVQTIPVQINLNGLDTVAGDFREDQLGHVLEPYLERIADFLVAYKERKILCFLPLIALSETFTQICKSKGLRAEHIDGNSPDRKEILARFSSGETRLLANAMLLAEGWDEPSVDTVVCLRPTQSRPLYAQMVGRGTRTHPGKEHLLLLDFLWLSQEHSLIQPAHLMASSEEEAEQVAESLKEADGDLIKALQLSQEKHIAKKLAERSKDNRDKEGKTYDVIALALTLKCPELLNYGATMSWMADPVSERQRAYLNYARIDLATVIDKGHASLILETINKRKKLELATIPQVFWLQRLGYPSPERATFAEAGMFLGSKWGNKRSVRASIPAFNKQYTKSDTFSSGKPIEKHHSTGMEQHKKQLRAKSNGKKDWLVRNNANGLYVYKEIDRGSELYRYSPAPVLMSEWHARECLKKAGGREKATMHRSEGK